MDWAPVFFFSPDNRFFSGVFTVIDCIFEYCCFFWVDIILDDNHVSHPLPEGFFSFFIYVTEAIMKIMMMTFSLEIIIKKNLTKSNKIIVIWINNSSKKKEKIYKHWFLKE